MLNFTYEKGSDYILIINEMWLQKTADFQSREYVGANEEELIAFIVVGVILFRMDLFGAAHGWRVPKRPPSLKSVTHILQ